MAASALARGVQEAARFAYVYILSPTGRAFKLAGTAVVAACVLTAKHVVVPVAVGLRDGAVATAGAGRAACRRLGLLVVEVGAGLRRVTVAVAVPVGSAVRETSRAVGGTMRQGGKAVVQGARWFAQVAKEVVQVRKR